MDYISIYKQIISQARLKEKDRICDNVYLEEHHIVPRCMGGLNIASNLVFLTAREHFIKPSLFHPLTKVKGFHNEGFIKERLYF
jgi:probable mobile endonuclease D|nr:MAG TPA: HNH endonuclease [Caudoviricetes sp.]